PPLHLADQPPLAAARSGRGPRKQRRPSRRGQQRRWRLAAHGYRRASHAAHRRNTGETPAEVPPNIKGQSLYVARVPWEESHSPTFSARHDSSQRGEAAAVVESLEAFRHEVAGLFERAPSDIAVVLPPRAAALTLAHP